MTAGEVIPTPDLAAGHETFEHGEHDGGRQVVAIVRAGASVGAAEPFTDEWLDSSNLRWRLRPNVYAPVLI